MNQLPSGWKVLSLAQLGSWVGGGTPSKARREFWENGSIPWVSPKDMKQRVLRDSEDHITPAAVDGSATHVVPAGSVLLVTRSGILRHTLPVALADVPVALNQDLKALIPGSDVVPAFVAWFLRSREQEILRECSKDGTTVQSIETRRLLRFCVPLPPASEQERIVGTIEEEFSRIDAGVDIVLGVQMKLGQLQKSAFEQLCSDRAGDPWPEVSLGELLTRGRYGTSTKCDVDGAGVPVLRIPNVEAGRISFEGLKRARNTQLDLSASMVSEDDILIIRTNGSRSLIGRAARVGPLPTAMAFASYLIQLRVDSRAIQPDFLVALLQAPRLRTRMEALAATTAGQYNISLSKLRTLRIPLPPLHVQQEDLLRTRHWSEAHDRVSVDLTRMQVQVHSLRAAILDAAFSGTLVKPELTGAGRVAVAESIARGAQSSKGNELARRGGAKVGR